MLLGSCHHALGARRCRKEDARVLLVSNHSLSLVELTNKRTVLHPWMIPGERQVPLSEYHPRV